MKHQPTYEEENFYDINVGDARFGDPLASFDDAPGGFRGWAQNILKRFWQAPVQGGADAPSYWSSFFLNQIAAELSSPFRFALKFVSLTVLPAIWTGLMWLFMTFVLDWKVPESCYKATIVFLWTLRDSVLSLPARPSLREFVGLFCHQAALKWMMWCTGFITYLYAFHYFHRPQSEAKGLGILVAVLTYFYTLPDVAYRYGATGLLRYLLQVICIVILTATSTVTGFLLATFLARPLWLCWAWAFFFGIVGFWIAVNQFYWCWDWWKAATTSGGDEVTYE